MADKVELKDLKKATTVVEQKIEKPAAKTEAPKADDKPNNIPFTYCTSNPNIIVIPIKINTLITISLTEIFLLKIIGSKIDTNKVVIDIQTTPIDTVLTFIE